jgi:photosystem II stability/assembly factor-like uncharacterized protein
MKTTINILFIFFLWGCNSEEKPTQLSINIFPVKSPVKESFRGLHAINENVAWLSGTGGTYMRTIDGGTNWQYGSFMDSVDFRGIHAFDSERAVMITAGAPTVIYKTEDGGENWSLKYKNDDPRAFFDAIGFWDEFNGVAFSDSFEGRFYLIKTEDGGNTWQQLLSAPEAEEGEGGFAASGTNMILRGTADIWIGTTSGRVFRSSDRGITWLSMETPLSNRENSSGGIFSIDADGKQVFIVGGDYMKPDEKDKNASYFEDSWKTPQQGPGGFRSSVVIVPGVNAVLTTGTNGTDASFDFGNTWTPIDTTGYHAISFGATENTGWMSGGSGRIAKIKIEEK